MHLRVLKLLYSFLMHIKNVDLLFKKDFKSAELLTKHPFSFNLESALKMTKETKETRKV